jgi:hypothetical protein
LVFLEVCCLVRVIWSEVIRRNPVIADYALPGTKSPNDELIQQVICTLRVHMLLRVLHRVFDVPSGILENEFFTAGVIREECGDVEDFTLIGNPATALRLMSKDIRGGEDANPLGHGEVIKVREYDDGR